MKRKHPIIAGNWKMHKTIAETENFIERLKPSLKDAKISVLLAPPFTALETAVRMAKGYSLQIGAQNMHAGDGGAFTGEISGAMLKDVGCSFVILGHSERRQLFKETDSFIHEKLKKCLSLLLTPILCVGETQEERTQNKTRQVLERQLEGCLKNLSFHGMIAYEPVWAIGTGKSATPEMAEEAHLIIRNFLKMPQIPLLYGGSVTQENIVSLLKCPHVEGALVGGASLEVEKFKAILHNAVL